MVDVPLLSSPVVEVLNTPKFELISAPNFRRAKTGKEVKIRKAKAKQVTRLGVELIVVPLVGEY
jgi:hypothetical protein